MPAIAMVLAWAGWSITSWGYLLIRGYDVPFTEWVNPLHPYSGPWPPLQIPDTTVLPAGAGYKQEGGAGSYQPPKPKAKGGTPAAGTTSSSSGGPGPSAV